MAETFLKMDFGVWFTDMVTQAVTMEGLLVQALFSAELEQENEPKFLTTRLGKSMGIAARRMGPELADLERPAGGMQS